MSLIVFVDDLCHDLEKDNAVLLVLFNLSTSFEITNHGILPDFQQELGLEALL